VKVVLIYRVLQHWRIPVFRRLAHWPELDFVALYGADYPGTKVVSAKDLNGFRSRRLATLRFRLGAKREPVPICPSLPLWLAIERPDVILAEGGSNAMNNVFMWLYCTLTRTPFVWWSLGELTAHETTSSAQRAFRWLYRTVESRATAWLGYSSVALDYFDRRGYPAEAQFRAVNCVDTTAVRKQIPRLRGRTAEIRKRFDLGDCNVLLYVGALNANKRVGDLLGAYASLKQDHPELRLVLVGDGPERAALKKQANDIGAADAIFAGQVVDDVGSYYEVADVFILPGLGGLAISEAMAHSLPVVATVADGSEVDLIRDGRNGRIVPVGDVQAIADSINEILYTPGELDSMKRYSSWVIDHEYNIDKYMENVVAALQFAAARNRQL
jgi:glycosyltransferase involved in cell wall biosynthesis